MKRLGTTEMRIGFALAGAVLAFDLMAFAFGQAPVATLSAAFAGTWGTPYGVGQVLFKATPLLYTGLAFHVALRAGLFNIGVEGQLALASLAVGIVGAKAGGGLAALALVLAVGVVVGAAWAGIAGSMRAYRGAHEIISGIMLNRCADVLLPWALVVGLGADGLRTPDLQPGVQLAPLDRWIHAFDGSAVSIAFPIAVVVVVLVYVWLDRSRVGREMRWVGLGPDACAAQGVPVARRRLQAMLLSGGLAGLCMTGTVLGYKGYYELGLGAGAGFSGIAVAMVGRSGPLALVAAALTFGTLAQAGLSINARVPREAMNVLEALTILLVAAAARKAPARPSAPIVEPEPAPAAEAPP